MSGCQAEPIFLSAEPFSRRWQKLYEDGSHMHLVKYVVFFQIFLHFINLFSQF